MDNTLETLVEEFAKDLAAWLDQPGEASARIGQLREQTQVLKGELGADGLRDALRAFDQAEKEAKRQQQRLAAEHIAETCRPLGVVLEPGEPPKRKPRKRPSNTPKPKSSGG